MKVDRKTCPKQKALTFLFKTGLQILWAVIELVLASVKCLHCLPFEFGSLPIPSYGTPDPISVSVWCIIKAEIRCESIHSTVGRGH